MSRKNNIEGQLNFLDMLMAEAPANSGQEQQLEKPFPATEQEEKKVVLSPGSFPECNLCWCATCEHSTVGGSVPRPFGENMRPCPSCELCISEGKADVCVIGSADEGCRFRAEKEGLGT